MTLVDDRSNTALPGPDRQALPDAPARYWDGIVRMQRMQTELLVSFELALAQRQRELWDQWACRWTGGLPFKR